MSSENLSNFFLIRIRDISDYIPVLLSSTDKKISNNVILCMNRETRCDDAPNLSSFYMFFNSLTLERGVNIHLNCKTVMIG